MSRQHGDKVAEHTAARRNVKVDYHSKNRLSHISNKERLKSVEDAFGIF